MSALPKISVVLPILAPTPFLRTMTNFTIRTLRMHADNKFELVVVEADGNEFAPFAEANYQLARSDHDKSKYGRDFSAIDQYLNFTPKIGALKEVNAGIAAASGDFIVGMGNDVIVPPHWDTELMLPFLEQKDCGASALAAFEPGAIVGPPQALPSPAYVEGMYSPFMMFRKGWTLDEAYHKIYQDSDLILRMYSAGLRSYRSCRAHVHHLLRMTSDRVEQEQHAKDLAHDERLFYERWSSCPFWMFGMMRSGSIAYGHEWEAWLRPIHLHYDPAVSR